MLKKLFGAAASRMVVPLAAALAGAGLSANALTVIGFAVTVGAAGLVAGGYLLAGGVMLLAGAAFDMLDGAVARLSGQISRRGAFLDSTLDRLSDTAVFVGLMVFFSGGTLLGLAPGGPVTALIAQDAHRWGIRLALAAMLLGLMVSYVRARAEGLGFTCTVGIAERPERIILVAAGLLLNQMDAALAVLAAASAVTLVQRFVHVWRQAGPA